MCTLCPYTYLFYARQRSAAPLHACGVLFSAQGSAKLWLSYLALAMAHDEQSLAAIAANSAAASRAWVHERLGRTDFELSCVCPCVCACVHVLACVALEAVVRHVSASLGIKPWELLRPFAFRLDGASAVAQMSALIA